MQVRVRRAEGLLDLGLINHQNGERALLRHRKSVAILLEVIAHFGRADLNFGLQLVGRQRDVLDFYFVGAALVLLLYLPVADHGAFNQDLAQLRKKHQPGHLAFVLRDTEILLRQKSRIAFLAHEFSVGK